MQTFASLLRSCALLALFTGSSGQSVPAGTLDEIRGELHEFRVELADENAALRHENTAFKNELRVELAEVQEKNTALRLELEDVRALLQTQPRRTVEKNFLSCMREDEISGDIFFDGCNVHIRSGGGATNATINGKGNLIIGYNKPKVRDFAEDLEDIESKRVRVFAEGLEDTELKKVRDFAEGLEDTESKKMEAEELDVSDSRGGSHNLVIGDEHEYTSYGGLIAG